MGCMYKKAAAVKVGQFMETTHKYLWANFRQTYEECLQNINLMIDNQLFLKQTSDPYLLVNQQHHFLCT